MTDIEAAIRRSAEFYGVSYEEGVRRHEKITDQENDPDRPICVGCASTPDELAASYSIHLDGPDDTLTNVIKREEGTYNPRNGHFLCDACYIKNGMPSSPYGWVCP